MHFQDTPSYWGAGRQQGEEAAWAPLAADAQDRLHGVCTRLGALRCVLGKSGAETLAG